MGTGDDGIVFDVTEYNVTGSGYGRAQMESSTTLPAQVDLLNMFHTKWWWSADGTNFSYLGHTADIMYVTLADPIPDYGSSFLALYESVLNTACRHTGATTKDQAVWNLWTDFSNRAVVRADNSTPLYYYQPGTGLNDNGLDDASLLRNGTGRCGSWASFFRDCLLVHGIDTYAIRTVLPSLANANNDFGFLINNWQVTNPGTSWDPAYPWVIWQTDPSAPVFEMFPQPDAGYGDLASITGNAGQNSPTPSEKVFWNHGIVTYYSRDTGGRIYFDPSYGAIYGISTMDSWALSLMEYSAIFGFWEGPLETLSGSLYICVRTATAQNDLKFDLPSGP